MARAQRAPERPARPPSSPAPAAPYRIAAPVPTLPVAQAALRCRGAQRRHGSARWCRSSRSPRSAGGSPPGRAAAARLARRAGRGSAPRSRVVAVQLRPARLALAPDPAPAPAIPHRRRDAFGLTLVGYMGNNVLPARGGELLKIGLLGARTTARRREVLGTVIVERVLDAGVLAVLFVVLTWARRRGRAGRPRRRRGRRGRALLARSASRSTCGCAGAAASSASPRRSARSPARCKLVRPRRPGVPLAAARRSSSGASTASTLLLIARSLGIELDLLAALAVIVLASLAAAIPAAPGYVGTFDAGMLLGLHARGHRGRRRRQRAAAGALRASSCR